MMSRFAVAAGLAALVVDARRMKQAVKSSAEEVTAGVLVAAPAGYDELPGKCSGQWIEMWADGHFAHYGEDHHISSVDDCADTCDEHPECAGFYTKNGKCSHWRSGAINARPQAGHMCYRKQGGAAPAPPAHHHGGGGGGSHASASCDAVQGFNVQPGKCSGRWIEVWADGHFSHYGEDHHVSGVSDCASTCSDHNECSGFYTKDGRCSHWRSGSLSVRPQAGHCCYTKSRSSLAQIEDELDLEMDTEEYEFEMSNSTEDMAEEDEEDLDAETGLPGCCFRNCCRGHANRRNQCWCNGSMCRARRHGGGFCWNNYHYHHRRQPRVRVNFR